MPPDPAPHPGPPALGEDAAPAYYAEDAVDRPPRPLAPIHPSYPPELRAMGIQGEVEARVAVRKDGAVGGAELISSSDARFTAAVREALKEARFDPAWKAGRPVASWVTLRLRFRLAD